MGCTKKFSKKNKKNRKRLSNRKKLSKRKKYNKKQKGGNMRDLKCYVITLNERPEVEDTINLFKKNNLILNKFNAIDTRKLDTRLFKIIPNFSSFINNKQSDGFNTAYKENIINDKYKLGSLGATFSHISLYREILENGYKNMLILEDDVVLDKNLFQKLPNMLDSLPKDWDIFILGFSCEYKHDKRCKVNDSVIKIYKDIYKINYFYGAYAYILSFKGAEKIINNIYPIWWHIDTMLSYLIQKGILNVYATIPNLIFHPGRFEISSFNYVMDTPYKNYKTTIRTD